MKTPALALLLLLATPGLSRADDVFKKADAFFGWLESAKATFAQCEPKEDGNHYTLCDGTEVDRDELKRLFAMKEGALRKYIEAKGVAVETDSKRKSFKQVTELHGQYLPLEKTILWRSTATTGSLVHEYLHHLEFMNPNKVNGHVYKAERMAIQKELVAVMDKSIADVQAAEKKGDKEKVGGYLATFMHASNSTRDFAFWQDLIDERSIFQLYLRFGKDFGATAADLELAKKNMGFICGNPKLKALLTQDCR